MNNTLQNYLNQEKVIHNLDNESKEYLGLIRLLNSLDNYFRYYKEDNMLKTLANNLLGEKDVNHWQESNMNRERYILMFIHKFDYPHGDSYNAPYTVAYDDDHAFDVFEKVREYKEENNLSWKEALLDYINASY